ncbi:hypothetical protein LSUE1_G003549 [Lachnellula suecica]|uniref:Uncharacterized protein n=1 Tax=Lachnellula suecica TaxID=602035 RepID=A0A8T9C8W9_9HELO|nr:hypothetical protein LSUE1_G003549 [Lachnellula suecica]
MAFDLQIPISAASSVAHTFPTDLFGTMSGLELLAAVTSIVSAFHGSLSLYRSWRDKQDDRASDEENRLLEYSLYIGATTIQKEYDRYYVRLGHRFSSGDSKVSFSTTISFSLTKIAAAQSQLAQYIAYFQYSLDTLVTESNSLGTQLPSVQNILAVSEATRIGVVHILAEQYQRMSQGGSSSRAFLSPSHRSALRGSVASEAQRDVVRRGAGRAYRSDWGEGS